MADFTDKTFKETYRDFYDANDGYYRVLYNSGRALQARELIEQQSIIQEEIARFGKNIFKEGALVNPGGATVNNKLEYIRLSTSSTFDATLIGQILTNGEVEFQILEMYDSIDGDPATLYVKYTDTSAVTNTNESPRVSSTETLTRVDGVAINLVVADDSADPISASGRATKAHFSSGDFFVQGHFVYMEGGSVFIDKYDPLPKVDIGFLIEQSIITEGDDENLYDNQGQVPDHTAPGAHRYQIKLIPTTRDKIDSDQNFVFIARVVDGIITREVTTFDSYNRINNLLAQRTKEESGNYVVDKFTAIFEDKDENNLNLDVSEGIAYVDGYRLEIGTTDITVPKARTTLEKLNDPVPATFGNYIYIEEGAAGSEGFGRLATFGHQRLRTSPTGNYIGYCNIRAVQRDATGIRLYIFNIRMDPIPPGGVGYYSFSDATVLEDPTPGLGNPQILLVDSVIHEASDNSLLFELPRTTPTKDSIAINYTSQVTTTTQADTSGEITLSGVEYTQWVIAKENGEILSIDPDMTGKYTGLDAGQSYTIAYYVEKTNITPRSKTITESVELYTITAADQEMRPLLLDHVDGIRLKSVKYRPSTETGPWDDAEDITHQFTLDGGQRDNFYDRSVAYLKSGYKIPYDSVAKDVEVIYDYYAHEDKEGYFCAASYVDDAYEDIPKHTLASGQVVCLRDVLDFRPTRQFSGSYLREFVVKAPLPQNASAISISTINYYLPRIDILVANAIDSRGGVGFGELQVIQGESAVIPREPEIPTGSMAMYKFKLNPYTFDRSDLSSTYIPNKRFTMKDIGELEKRIDNLYEMTTLTQLETVTSTLPIVDTSGQEIIKTGFVADNFSSYLYSDINNSNYRASQDPNGSLKPSFRQNSVRLSYSSDNVDAVVKKGDLVTLPFVNTSMVEQSLATEIVNVNPFAVVTQVGTMELSPSSDEWVETRDLSVVMQTVERNLEDFQQSQYDADLFDYGGISSGIIGYTTPIDVSYRDTTVTIQDYSGERVAGEEVTPYMRSRRINVMVKGMRPNTKLFAFFGEKDVSSWVRQETTTQRFADNPQEFGSQYASATEYPSDLGGPSVLQTNGKGELIASFFLPNTDTIKFRTGKHEFKLLDVSVNDENKSTVSARASYSSTDYVDDTQQTIRTTRVVDTGEGRRDPLAQTFLVDQIENPNGLFLTTARIFLESKDENLPLQVQLRSVENGVPTTRIVPGSIRFIDPDDITVKPFDATTTMAEVQSTPTTVEFNEPIYLTSGEEYAIVLLSESVNYNVYIAETYDYVIGSREDKVSRQPAVGSLFLSQNSFSWAPDQSKDLMFELDRAEFSSSGDLVLDNATLPKVALGTDPIETTSGSTSVKVYHQGHGFSLNDNVAISGVANDIGGVSLSDLNGTFSVTSVNWDGYTIDVPTAAPMSGIGGGDTVVASQQVYYDIFIPKMQSILPKGTNVSSKLFDAKAKSYGGNSASDSRKLGQFSYSLPSSLANARQVFLNDYNTNSQPSIVASSENASGGETMKFNLQMSTSDTKVSPVIDLQRVSVLTLENVIDNVDAAQHITNPVTVNDSSKAIKVVFSANRPTGSDFEVYVKSATDEDALSATDDDDNFITDWVLVSIDKALPTDENPTTFREYEYTIDLSQFTAYQVKVVMQSNNSSKSPTIRDLRAIALVNGTS